MNHQEVSGDRVAETLASFPPPSQPPAPCDGCAEGHAELDRAMQRMMQEARMQPRSVRFQIPNTLSFGGFVVVPKWEVPEWIAYFEAGGLKAWMVKEDGDE